MPDPSTHAATVSATAPAVAVAASAFHITLWPFGIAFIAGCVALIYLNRMLPKEALLSVIGSTLIGGATAQLSATPILLIATSFAPSISSWSQDGKMPMTFIIAMVIGLFCQKAMPALLRRADKQLGGD